MSEGPRRVHATAPDSERSARDPGSTGLVLRAVDPSLRFLAPRDRGLRRVLTWNAVGLSLIVSAALASPVGAGVLGMLGAGAIGYGWLSGLVRGQLPERILRARAQLRSSPEQGRASLEAIARASVPPQHRLEAAGHASLLALERGDVARAIELVSFEASDEGPGGRARGLEHGLVGELMRSILAWISPGAFRRVAHSTAFELDPLQREGLARPEDVEEFLELLGLLRVLEAAAAADSEPVLLAWRQCRDSGLSRRFPRLFLLAWAAAARRLEPVREELQAELATRTADRALLERVFPELSAGTRSESVYREVALVADGGDAVDRALALVSAPAAVALAARCRIDPVAIRHFNAAVVRRWLLLTAASLSASFVAGNALGGVLGAWTATALASYVVAPIAVIGAIRNMRRGKLRLRLSPLRGLERALAPEWLREFENSPPVRGSSFALEQEHLLLYVACAMAETELAAGRAFAAWSLVEWYFRGFAPQRVELGALHPVAASLVRVAALSGHLAEARRVSDALAGTKPSRDRSRRTAYGSAPRALVLARALVFARAGKWHDASTQLGLASRLPRVWMAERDRALYDVVAFVAGRRTRLASEAVSPAPLDRHAGQLAWISGLAPELLEDLETADGGGQGAP